MTELDFEGRCTCGRVILEAGAAKKLEAAFDQAAKHPIVSFLQKLLDGRIRGARSDHFFDLMVRIEDYCRTGHLSIPDEMNDLGDGIWELKRHNLRVAFFIANSDVSRATHGFRKGTKKTPLGEIDKAKAIRREDCGHNVIP